MTKSSLDQGRATEPAPSSGHVPESGMMREGGTCDLYAPGHQIHYRHQGDAVRSPSGRVTETLVDGSTVILVLEDGEELRWRHHDPERLGRILELVPGTRTVYPRFHALRVGPYWFNCASETDPWQDCRVVGAQRRG
jgi:hypothetical protein